MFSLAVKFCYMWFPLKTSKNDLYMYVIVSIIKGIGFTSKFYYKASVARQAKF